MTHLPLLSRILTISVALVILLGIFLIVVFTLVLPWSERWGATAGELTTALLGDELVPAPALQITRAITIHASPQQVYPWLLQLGVDRGGMYSYDWLENLVGLKVHSTSRINPAWQDLAVGDFIRLTPPDYFVSPGPGLYVVSMDAGRSLIGCFGMENEQPDPCTTTWQFVLQPQADGSTRLVLRGRSTLQTGLAGQVGRFFNLIPFIMERQMLLGIRARAEAMP
jgi:hypothetical protein